MEKHKPGWLKSEKIRQLFSYAECNVSEQIDRNLVYPKLEPKNEDDKFPIEGPLPENITFPLSSIKSIKTVVKDKKEREQQIVRQEKIKKEKEAANNLETKKKEQKDKDLQEEIVLDFPNTKCKVTKDILNTPLKKNKHFSYSKKQVPSIIEQLKRCWKDDHKAFYKKKKLAKFSEFPWT